MKLYWRIALFLVAGVFLLTACGGDSKGKTTALGNLTANDKGTKDVSSATSLTLEADDFYFSPTFLKGTAGQKLKITVDNDSNTLHNFSVPAVALDKDVPGKTKVEVDVTFPQSGVLLFLCKLHSSQGMNGELLVGDAQPQAASATVASPTVKLTKNPTLGDIITDPAGRTLYMFSTDVPGSGKSATTGNTAVTWPAFTLPSGEPIKPAGLTGDLTLITRDDGSKQVAYKGLPLYYYNQDANAGDTNGQGRGNVWYVMNDAGPVGR